MTTELAAKPAESRPCYLAGCRCPGCRSANNRYKQRRRGGNVPPFVASGRAREHVRLLLKAGMTVAGIAERAGLPRAVVHRLLGTCCGYKPVRRIRPATEDTILGVRPDASPTTETPADSGKPWWAVLELSALPDDLDLAWRAQARCNDPDVPTGLFFPGRGDGETSKLAQEFCAGCPVREPGLEFALTTGALGIWGGTTELQREQMHGRRQRHGQSE